MKPEILQQLLADRAAKTKGMESEERKLYNTYSAICYREALVDDPKRFSDVEALGAFPAAMLRRDGVCTAAERRQTSAPSRSRYPTLRMSYRSFQSIPMQVPAAKDCVVERRIARASALR